MIQLEDRFVAPGMQAADEHENKLRPQSLREFIGQENIKKTLEIYLEAARMRKEPLDHMLLYGPPGLGKTCLSHIVANEMAAQIKIAQGPAIEKPGDLVSMLTNLNNGDVLFIDEIHRLSRTVEEYLYPAMEDYVLDLFIGQGPSARSIRFNLPKFTLIGATTKAGLLAPPLRDRFGIQYRLEPYEVEDIMTIVKRSAGILGVEADQGGAKEIALRSRGTPRVANRLLARVRDFACVKADGIITRDVAKEALTMLEIDELGLDRVDRALLSTMIVKFEGRPVGLNTLSAATGEDSRTIEDVYEPFLLQIGFLMRTPSGRIPTQLACRHMGLQMPGQSQIRFDIEDEKARIDKQEG